MNRRLALLFFCVFMALTAGAQETPPTDTTVITVASVQQIDRVAVVGKRPLVVQRQGRTIVNVDRTILADAGSLTDLLKRSPGLTLDENENITVFGKGSPIVYIDNREMTSTEELTSLQSTDIDRIEIVRNPSSRYSAAGHAVVRIVTKRAKADKIALTLYDNLAFSRKISNTAGAQLDHKSGRWANLLSYSFANSNHLDHDEEYEVNTQPTYTIHNGGPLDRQYSMERHNVFSGNEYSINDRNRVGLQFSGTWSDGVSRDLKRQTIRKTGETDIERLIAQHSKPSRANLYNTSVSYEHDPDSVNSFSIVLSYAHRDSRNNNRIAETELADGAVTNSRITSTGAYNVLSAQADWGFRLGRAADATLGAKFSSVASDGKSSHRNTDTGETRYSQTSRIDDRIAAGYFELVKEIGDFSLTGGLRYEYTSSDTHSDDAMVDTTYHSLFPSLSADWSTGDWGVNLSWSRRIRRPTFGEINPSITYFDALSYGIGNPLLRPTYSDNIELAVSFHDLTFTADYTRRRDYIVQTALNDPVDPDITRWTSLNIPRSNYLNLALSYARSWRVYSGSYEVYFEKPYTKVPYLGGVITRNKASWDITVSNTFNITKSLSLNCDLNYYTAGEDGLTRWEPSLNMEAGAVWKLFADRLTLSLYANDILRTANYNNWEDRYGNIISGYRGNADTRYVRLGVRWNFNNIKSGVSRHQSNADELNRLQ